MKDLKRKRIITIVVTALIMTCLFSIGVFAWFTVTNQASVNKLAISVNDDGSIPYIKKTDQERCENMVFVLQDKTPYIRTQKCDGSSGTFILARKKQYGRTKYELFVCSRNGMRK